MTTSELLASVRQIRLGVGRDHPVARVLGLGAGAATVLLAVQIVGFWSEEATGRVAALSIVAAVALLVSGRLPRVIGALVAVFVCCSLWTLLQPGGRHLVLVTIVVLAALAVLWALQVRLRRPQLAGRRWAMVMIGSCLLIAEVLGSTNMGMTLKTIPFAAAMSDDAARSRSGSRGDAAFACPGDEKAPGPFPGADGCTVEQAGDGSVVVAYNHFDSAPFVMHPNGPPIDSGLVFSPGGAPLLRRWAHVTQPVCVNHITGPWYEYISGYPEGDSSGGARCPDGLTEQGMR